MAVVCLKFLTHGVGLRPITCSSIHLGQCRIMESQQKAILRMQETCCKQGTLRMPQGQVGDGTRVCLMRVLIILIATMTEVPSRPRSAGFVFFFFYAA